MDPCHAFEVQKMNFSVQRPCGQGSRRLFLQGERARLAAEHDVIVALFISEYGKDDFFIEVMPEYREVYPAIFRWIDDHWATTRENVEIDVYSDDEEKIRRLEAQGFRFKCHFENKRTYDLDAIDLGYALEDGFTVQAFSESLNYPSRVALVQSAFDNPGYKEVSLRGLVSSPDYIDEYHLVVVSPEGEHVAYCVGWHEHANDHAGYIEPVGTHAEISKAGIRLSRDQGMLQADEGRMASERSRSHLARSRTSRTTFTIRCTHGSSERSTSTLRRMA